MPTPRKRVSWMEETTKEHQERVRNYGHRPPLRTMGEMAEEFGVSARALSALVWHDPNAPKPKYRVGSHTASKSTWIEPNALRAWWEQRKSGETK